MARKLDSKNHAIRLFYQIGGVLKTTDYIKGVGDDGNLPNENGESIDQFQALSQQYGWQTNGSKLLKQLYAYPYWGFGLYWSNVFQYG